MSGLSALGLWALACSSPEPEMEMAAAGPVVDLLPLLNQDLLPLLDQDIAGFSLDGEARDAIGTPGSWSATAHLNLPHTGSEPTLRFAIGTVAPPSCHPSVQAQWTLTQGTHTETLWTHDAPTVPNRWTAQAVELSGWTGPVALSLEVQAKGDCVSHFLIGEPRLVTHSPSEGPDLWVVIIDALRADRVFDLPGRPPRQVRTPNLDALRARGLSFTTAWSTASWTREAVFSMLTSAQPRALEETDLVYREAIARGRHMDARELRLPDTVPTVSEQLQTAGYRTIARVANPLLPPGSGPSRGFDSYALAGNDRDLIDRLPAAMAETDPRRPQLVWTHIMGPHTPYQYRPGHTEHHYAARGIARPPPAEIKAIELWRDDAPADWVEQVTAQYDGDVEHADQLLGQIVAAMEETGRVDSWLIITSDHGEELNEHGSFEHGHTHYEELLQVPLIVVPPADWAGTRGIRPQPVSLADLPATLAALAGLEATWNGQSLLSSNAPDRTLLASGTLYGPRRRALRTGTHKKIETQGVIEHFDLSTDPTEQAPLNTGNSPTEFGTEWAARMAPAPTGTADRSAPVQNLDQDQLDARLQALGYQEGAHPSQSTP